MLRSLWFRLTGTVILTVGLTLTVALIAFLVVTRRELVEFVEETAAAITSIAQGIEVAESQRPLRIDPIVIDPGEASDPFGPGRTVTIPIPEQFATEMSRELPSVVQSEGSEFVNDVRDAILGAITFSFLAAVLASTWLFWQITRPLTKLRDAAETIAGGNLDIRVPVKKKDEVGRVAMAFNHMAGELQRQEGLRKRMVADAAHELRTPLSVMRGNLEAMIDDLIPSSPEELAAIHNEVLRLARLVEDLRLLSLADAGELKLSMGSVDSGQLVENAVRRMTPLAKAKGVRLVGDISAGSASVNGDEDKLQQVLANLIGNAIRHTPAGKRVSVQSRTTNGTVELVVDDQGPGVDPDELAQLFERFWRGDKSRSRDGGGSGLGLSIVQQLVEMHQGQVEATLPDSGGLMVTVKLPIAGLSSSESG